MSLTIQCFRCMSEDGAFRPQVPGSTAPLRAYCDDCWEATRSKEQGLAKSALECSGCGEITAHVQRTSDGRRWLCDKCFSRDDAENPHPAYYGGADNPYEAIKVIRAWGLNFALGNVLKYVRRCDEKGGLDDLRKARTYLDEEIAAREGKA